MELFTIRIKFAVYYVLHFNTVRQVAAQLRAKSAIYVCLVIRCFRTVRGKYPAQTWVVTHFVGLHVYLAPSVSIGIAIRHASMLFLVYGIWPWCYSYLTPQFGDFCRVSVNCIFYRANHFSAYARSWDRMSSVRLSVCLFVRLSVMLVDCDHIGWKSWKLIARTISPTPSLFVAKRRST